MRLQLSRAAEVDLEVIADYIAQDSAENADRFLQALRLQCQNCFARQWLM